MTSISRINNKIASKISSTATSSSLPAATPASAAPASRKLFSILPRSAAPQRCFPLSENSAGCRNSGTVPDW